PILQQKVQNQDDVQVSIEAARESMTLLKNDNATLPLTAESVKKILVLGPTSNNLGHLSGGWTIQWQGATADLWHGDINDEQFYKKGITILEGIQNSAPKDIEVDHILGFDIHGNEQDMDWIIERIQDYDAFVVCIGEHVYSELPGNIHDLTLPQGQIENIDKLAKAAGDTPIVTVLLEGRPRTLNSIQSNSNAILQAYLPGPWGGQAIGEVLFGKTNPSGRLPYTYPKYAGDMNMNYWRPACDLFDPLYEFGHGLSYSNFEYGNITVDGQLNDASENVQMLVVGEKEKAVLVNVTNTSPVDGKETVLMYIQQPFRTVTPPAKLLKGFQKVFIPAGETVNVRFSVNADMFRYTGLDNIPQGTIDNGPAKVLIGSQVFDFEVVDPSTE
ncbi:hypothetical protein CU098_012500, partial [Rhizopus stolonifer]